MRRVWGAAAWGLAVSMLVCTAAGCKRRHGGAKRDKADAEKDSLRVARVVLYQNGIGYIEKRGGHGGCAVR